MGGGKSPIPLRHARACRSARMRNEDIDADPDPRTAARYSLYISCCADAGQQSGFPENGPAHPYESLTIRANYAPAREAAVSMRVWQFTKALQQAVV